VYVLDFDAKQNYVFRNFCLLVINTLYKYHRVYKSQQNALSPDTPVRAYEHEDSRHVLRVCFVSSGSLAADGEG